MTRQLRTVTMLLAGVATLSVLFFFAGGTAHAQSGGGVGAGGTGSNTSGPGHYTYYGWGWRLYSTSGSGPVDGFRNDAFNGQVWNAAKAACTGHSANIAVFVILTSGGDAMGYSYQDNYYGPPRYLGYLSSSPYISVPQAESVYNSLPSSLKTGFTFGSNVGWFCYGYTSNASLDGYKIDDSGTGASPTAIDGRTVSVSGVGSRTTNPFYFTNAIPAGGHTISTSAPLGWRVIGYKICRSDSSTCTASYLNNPSGMTASSGTTGNLSFTAGKTYHMRWIFKQLQPATLDGYKIDNMGGNGAIGGGTTGTFTGATVTVANSSDAQNPFYFNSNVAGHAPSISFSGTNSLTLQRSITLNGIPPGWRLIGYGICAGGGCNPLASPVSISPTITSYTITNYNFTNGQNYHMRWIFDKIDPPKCNGLTGVTSPVVAGFPITFAASIALDAWPLSPVPTMTVTVTGPGGTTPVPTRTYYDSSTGLSPQYTRSGTTITTPSITTPSLTTAGQYTITYNTTGFWAMVPTCTVTIDAGNQPYLTVNGGDTVAGPDGIYGYNQNTGTYNGAGAQLAALSSGDIIGFVTGKGLPSIGSGYSLGFANVPAPGVGSGNYGGKFGVLPPMSTIPAGLTVTGNRSVSVDVGSLPSGVYEVADGTVISGTVPANRDVTLIAPSGDIIIGGDIAYSYGSLTDVPRLNVYAQDGNIIFRGNVTIAHGVFNAENKTGDPATNGLVYTCGVGATGVVYAQLSANGASCVNRLTIFGSVTANKIILGRISGTWVPTQADKAPSETIQYSPEVWMHRSNSSGSGATEGMFDSYVSLPPVL